VGQNQPVLCAVGDLVEDVVVRVYQPIRAGTDTTATIERRAGGSAASVAREAARFGPSRFIGRVGDDAIGATLVSGLLLDGVDAQVQRAGRTGTIVVLVDESGERTMFPDRGACIELEDVPDDWLTGVTVLHLPSYSLFGEPIGTTCARMVDVARRDGGRVSVDASSTGVLTDVGVDEAMRRFAELRPDVLFANAEEAAMLDLAGWPGAVIVKRGPDPIDVVMDGRRRSVPVPAVAAGTDTTGAGDAFAGGFLAAWTAGADVLTATAAGVASASRLLRSRIPVTSPL
jgi:sugar/nucleoside kinase (ribokinase family)